MSEVVKWPTPESAAQNRPSREVAMEAVRTLIAWAGDDPNREGLKDTPQRVIDAYREWFRGYDERPEDDDIVDQLHEQLALALREPLHEGSPDVC